MVYLSTKIKKLLFSILIEVTKYAAVLKHRFFSQTAAIFGKVYFPRRKLNKQIAIAQRVINILKKILRSTFIFIFMNNGGLQH